MKSLLKNLFISGTLFFIPFSAQSAENHPCSNLQTQFEITQCTGKEYKKSDEKLNQTYKKLIPLLDKDRKKELVKAESAWIKFRDAECSYQSFLYRGGTAYSMFYASCLTEITDKRTKDLEESIKNASQ